MTLAVDADITADPIGRRYLTRTDAGTIRLAGTRVSLDSVVYAFNRGESAEEIQRNLPTLTLEEVYAAISLYLAHKVQVDEYLREQETHYEQMRAQSRRDDPERYERLRRAKAEWIAAGRPSLSARHAGVAGGQNGTAEQGR